MHVFFFLFIQGQLWLLCQNKGRTWGKSDETVQQRARTNKAHEGILSEMFQSELNYPDCTIVYYIKMAILSGNRRMMTKKAEF